MIQFTLTFAAISVGIGAVTMGFTDLFWAPLFFFALGISIGLFNVAIWVGGIGLGISAILYVIVHFFEPRWLQVLIEEISTL